MGNVIISFFKFWFSLGQSDLLRYMLHKANHYNFIRDHIKQIENLFTENFKDFEFEDFDYLTEEEPVLEGILHWFILKYKYNYLSKGVSKTLNTF